MLIAKLHSIAFQLKGAKLPVPLSSRIQPGNENETTLEAPPTLNDFNVLWQEGGL